MRRRALHVTVVFALLTGLFALLGSAASAAPSNQTVTTSGFCGINIFYAQGARVVARVTETMTPSQVSTDQSATIAVDLYTMFGRFFNSGGAPFGPLPYVGFVVTGPNASGATPPSGTVKADTNGHAIITYSNSLAGTDTVLVYWDMNNNGVRDCLEPVTVVQVTFEAGLSLSPATQTVAADGTSTATVTATIAGYTDTNLPPAGAQVIGTVSGGPSTSVTFNAIACTPSGCTATATLGPETTTGTDTVNAFLDLNGNSTQDANEPSSDNTADVVWVAPTLALSPATQTVAADGTATATVTATITGYTSATLPGTAVIRGTVSGGPSSSITFGTITCGATDCTATATLGPTTTTGTDTVSAYLDVNGNSTQDAGEPSAAASVTVTWTGGA